MEKRYRSGYIQIPIALLDHSELSPFDIAVYLTILSHRHRETGLCYPSLARLREKTGISQKPLLKSRQKLKTIGLIDWSLQKKKQKQQTCFYTFPLIEDPRRITDVLDKLDKWKSATRRKRFSRGLRKDMPF